MKLLERFLPTAKLLFTIFVSVALLVMIDAQFQQKTTLDKHLTELTQLKNNAKVTVQYVDSLKQQITDYQTRAAIAQSQANTLNTQVVGMKKETRHLLTLVDSLKHTARDSVELARTVIPVQDSIIKAQIKITQTLDKQVERLNVTIANKDTVITLQKVSIDTLRVAVDSLTKLKTPKDPDKWWIFKLPSRKVVAGTSFIVGVVSTIVVSR